MILRYLDKKRVYSSRFILISKMLSSRLFSRSEQKQADQLKEPEIIQDLFTGIKQGTPKYLKELKLKKFMETMETIYLEEAKWERKLAERNYTLNCAILGGKNPIHDIFLAYSKLNYRGFSGENVSNTVSYIANVFKARGANPINYFDYSVVETFNSWQMKHLIDDIKFGLKPSSIFLPYHIAKV